MPDRFRVTKSDADLASKDTDAGVTEKLVESPVSPGKSFFSILIDLVFILTSHYWFVGYTQTTFVLTSLNSIHWTGKANYLKHQQNGIITGTKKFKHGKLCEIKNCNRCNNLKEWTTVLLLAVCQNDVRQKEGSAWCKTAI